ncbi:sigma-70 family RNA polymerase sigma factor [Stutzerimonas azotifigens]|uniref:sigma-70 family RNA polymerase sigma factor n=1 Tax=Stutzerimonas azotifigens TaxID=291995 RepID=UPI00041C8D21|nr:sigma-70 family RNA polymerase sigma factor [Stutzerimonas azotifigens]
MRQDITDEQLRALLPRLRRFALWLTRHGASADDLVQSAVERALTWRGTRQADGDLRAWLFTILYRQFIDGQRRQRRYARILALFVHAEEQTTATEEVAEARSMLEAFARLAPEQRALLLLVGVEGLSYREAADALGVPIGTVMSRLSRARHALRALGEGQINLPPVRLLK